MSTERNPRIKVISSQTIQVDGEDHTLMNPLRWCISNNFVGEKVELAGYTIPHPSDDVSNLTIQLCDEKSQNAQAILQKMLEGLGCMQAIGRKVASEVERAEADLDK